MNNKENLRLFLGSVFIGGLVAVLDLILLYLFTDIFKINYLYSTPLAFFIVTIINYSANKYFNFRNKSKRIFLQFSIFTIISIITLLLNQAIVYVLVEYFKLWYMYAQSVAILILLFWNFYLNKKITFNLLR